jgi:uncharacterized protein with GYD domain
LVPEGKPTPHRKIMERRRTMPTYIWLVKWTDQGIRNVKETTKRAKSFREMAEKMKVKVREILWTMGRFDLVLLIDAPDDETVNRLALGLGMSGNAKTETLKAFSAQEMDQILKGLP